MIDALAFKGIWDRHGFDSVLSRLEHIQRQVEEERTFQSNNYPKLASALRFELTTRFLSDTIVIASHSSSQLKGTRAFLPDNTDQAFWDKLGADAKNIDTAAEFVALKVVVGVIARALGAALAGCANKELPALNYRGAVACGEYLINDNFLIGQAVDYYGEWFEKADASIVMFHPSAQDFWMRCQAARDAMQGGIIQTGQFTVQDIKSYMNLCEVIQYEVPLKPRSVGSGCLPRLRRIWQERLETPTVGTSVLNPFSRFPREEWEGLRTAVLDLMRPDPPDGESAQVSITRKRDNTRRFLDHVVATAPVCFPPQPPSAEEAVRIIESQPKP